MLATLHTPTIYILRGPKDIAYPNGMDDFARIAHVPVAVANLPVGHGGTFLEPNGGAAASVAVSWLDWSLVATCRAPDGSWVRTAGCWELLARSDHCAS